MRREVICYLFWLAIITASTKEIFDALSLYETTFFWPTALSVLAISILVFSILVVFGNKNPERFVKLLLSLMLAKLIALIVLVAVVIYIDPENANVNSVLFLVLYTCYTITGVALIFKKMTSVN